MFYDCYGRPASDKDFMSAYKKCAPYEIVQIGKATYMRFSSKDFGAIHKILEKDDGSIVSAWTMGSWSEKTTITFSVDMNTAIEID